MSVSVDLRKFRPLGIDRVELAALTMTPSPLMVDIEGASL